LAKRIYVQPTTIKKANDFVKKNHRHHRPTHNNTGRFALSARCAITSKEVGVVIAGNPVSATYMDGVTLELTRLCTITQAPRGTCSFLLSRAAKIWSLMGGSRIITYTLDSESGASLRGAGWQQTATVKPHKDWLLKSLRDGKPRDNLEIYSMRKCRWELQVGEAV